MPQISIPTLFVLGAGPKICIHTLLVLRAGPKICISTLFVLGAGPQIWIPTLFVLGAGPKICIPTLFVLGAAPKICIHTLFVLGTGSQICIPTLLYCHWIVADRSLGSPLKFLITHPLLSRDHRYVPFKVRRISTRKTKNKCLTKHEICQNKLYLYQILHLKSYCKLKNMLNFLFKIQNQFLFIFLWTKVQVFFR